MKKLLRWFGIGLAIVGGLLLLAVAGMYFNSSRQLNRTYEFASESVTIPTNEQSIANGKKWVEIACADCHGADFSGTAMIDDPAIGHLDSANLTSGKGGVGSTYTDEDWIRALRHGVGKDGKPLFIMPSSAFWNFSDEDLGEIIAYIKTVPSVDHETTAKLSFLGTMVLPNDPTFLHVKLIDHSSRPALPAAGVTVDYGQYLVNVSACRDCHGTDLSGRPGTNGKPATPNLTPGGELAFWSTEEFINTMRTGAAPSGHPLDPNEMPWKGYRLYSDDELAAIFMYLRSLPKCRPITVSSRRSRKDNSMVIFSGFSSNDVPYAKLSSKGTILVVLTGSELEHQPPTKTAQQGYYIGLKRLTQQYSILACGIAQQAIHIARLFSICFTRGKAGLNNFIYFFNSFKNRFTSC